MEAEPAPILGGRRTRYASRFSRLGEYWMKTLRHCSWRGSLSKAFEEPSLRLPSLSDSSYSIPRKQFIMALNYAIVRDTALCSDARWDATLEDLFDTFDIDGSDTVDYREVIVALLFFKQSLNIEPETQVLSWWRAYDGDVQGGLPPAEFLVLLCSLCTTPGEVRRIVSCVDLPVLEAFSRFRPSRTRGAIESRVPAPMADGDVDILESCGIRRGSMVWQRFHAEAGDAPPAGVQTPTTSNAAAAEVNPIVAKALTIRGKYEARFQIQSAESTAAAAAAAAALAERKTGPPPLLSQEDYERDQQTDARKRLGANGCSSNSSSSSFVLDELATGDGVDSDGGPRVRNVLDVDADARHLTAVALSAVRSAAINPTAPARGKPGRIDAACIHLLFRIAPRLAAELNLLRMARTHPTLRTEYQRQQLVLASLRVRNNLSLAREAAGEARADQFFVRTTLGKALRAWAAWSKTRLFRATLVRSFSVRRLTRLWWRTARDHRLARARADVADLAYGVALMRRAFRGWQQATRMEAALASSAAHRADAFYAFSLKHTVLASFVSHAHGQRAAKHFRATLLRKCIRQWAASAAALKAEAHEAAVHAQATRAALAANDGDWQRMISHLDSEADARAAADVAAQHARAEAAFFKEADAIAEAARLQGARAEAVRRLRESRVLKAQTDAQVAAWHAKDAAFQSAFDEEWDSTIAAAVRDARTAVSAALTTRAGKAAVRQEAAAILAVDSVEAATQAGSDFSAVFDMNSGCIHFVLLQPQPSAAAFTTTTTTAASAGARRSSAPLVYVLDTMTLKDAAVVAEAHLIARGAEERRDELTKEREAAWALALRMRASAKVHHAWVCWRLRRRFLDEIRARTETLVDPGTGIPFYLDTDTGVAYHNKLLLFRAEEVHPMPEWFVKRNDVGAVVYQHTQQAWLTSETPPEGFAMCSLCGVDFASRRCLGSGCDGAIYCFGCFCSVHLRRQLQSVALGLLGSPPVPPSPSSSPPTAAGGGARDGPTGGASDTAATFAGVGGATSPAGLDKLARALPRRRSSAATVVASPFEQHWSQFTRIPVRNNNTAQLQAGKSTRRLKVLAAQQRTRRQSIVALAGGSLMYTEH